MFGMKSLSFGVILMMVAQLASGQRRGRGRGKNENFERNVARLHRVSYEGGVDNGIYKNKYVSFNSGNDIGGKPGKGAFYNFAKRSIPYAQVQTPAGFVSVEDLKCATLEACLGGTEAPLRHASQISSLMNSMDYLLQPAFRVGFFGRSKDYCRRIYADCDDNSNL